MAKYSLLSCCLSLHNADLTNIEDRAYEPDINHAVPVFQLLDIDVCAQAIFDFLPLRDLVRSERVCRRWQNAIHEYFKHEHTVSFYDLFDKNAVHLAKFGSNDKTDICSSHRKLQISAEAFPVSCACIIIEKWGHCIVKVLTARQEDEYFELIAEKCTHLYCVKFVGQRKQKQNLMSQLFQSKVQMGKKLNLPLNKIKKCKQLKKIAFKCIFDLRDDEVAILLQNIDYEELEICDICLYGICLQQNKHENLKSLNVSCMWMNFLANDLVNATKNMQNLKSLTLDSNCLPILIHAHIIIRELPKLEHLSLSNYYYDWTDLRWDDNFQTNAFIESLSQLKNLKRLYLHCNETVDDLMLEALAKCRSLEYLDISNDSGKHIMFWSSRGVAALCHRPPPAVTILCLGYIQYIQSMDLLKCVRNIKTPIVQELETMGFVEFTPKWLDNASNESMLRKHPLEVDAITVPNLTEESYPDLKIVLSRAHHS